MAPTIVTSVRMAPEDRDQIEQLARAAGESFAEWVGRKAKQPDLPSRVECRLLDLACALDQDEAKVLARILQRYFAERIAVATVHGAVPQDSLEFAEGISDEQLEAVLIDHAVRREQQALAQAIMLSAYQAGGHIARSELNQLKNLSGDDYGTALLLIERGHWHVVED